MSCGVGGRHGLDLAFLCLWCRPAAVAQIPPLAWEPPYALDVALKSKNETKQKEFLCINITPKAKMLINEIQQ